MDDLRQEHQAKLDKLTAQHEVTVENTKLETERKMKDSLDLKQEFTTMGSNFAAERSALQRQVNNSDERIRKMEEMNKLEIENVKREGQTALSSELESLSLKLEEAEDQLFDSRQEAKKRAAEHALATWKTATNAEKRYESIRKEMQGLLNEANLTVLKLCVIVKEVEAARHVTQGILTSHKSGELAQRRDAMEAELRQFEDQVRDIEDQIREHNRESSMTNGRVNVAHARKKMESKAAEKLVQILLEQQRLLLGKLEEGKSFSDRCQLLVSMAGLPWPPPNEPSMQFILAMNKRRQEEEERAM
eukprot:gene33376-43151_t